MIEGLILEIELHKKIIITSRGFISSRGRSAICAWSVRVSASSKTIIFGPVEAKRELKDARIKGYTRLRTASRPRSSLELRKRARPKNDVFSLLSGPHLCRASTNSFADVVFPEPGGPINKRCDCEEGFCNIVCNKHSILLGRPRFSITVSLNVSFRPFPHCYMGRVKGLKLWSAL